jgi:hypothetical protein
VLTLSLMVRNYLCREVPPRQVGWWPSPCPEALQLTFIDRNPHLPVNCVTKWGKSCAQGRQGWQGRLPFLFPPPPSLEDPDLGGCPPPALSLPVQRCVGFSLSPSPRFLIGGTLRLPPCRIFGRVGISQLTPATPKTLHKITSAMKR